jgi:predicted MFS family arabinose efflux permease
MSYVSLVTVVIQLTVPREVQGRVLSLWAAGAALTFVGALPMGVVADVFTWPIAVTSGAVITLAFILWLGVWRPTLRHMKV